MAKTQLTRDIEAALHAWHPSSYGGYRVDSFRQGFDALEVPVECGSVKSGLVDFVRVQECFTSETKYGTCKLASLIETDTGASLTAIQQKAKEATCVKDISSIDFCREHCSERWCHFHKTNHLYTLDAVITCVEIKISVSDFHSAHGHNFVGHCNYYAMPTEVYKKVKGEIPEDIGVLLYYDGESTCGIRKAKERKPQILSESTQKWLILSVAKRLPRFDKN